MDEGFRIAKNVSVIRKENTSMKIRDYFDVNDIRVFGYKGKMCKMYTELEEVEHALWGDNSKLFKIGDQVFTLHPLAGKIKGKIVSMRVKNQKVRVKVKIPVETWEMNLNHKIEDTFDKIRTLIKEDHGQPAVEKLRTLNEDLSKLCRARVTCEKEVTNKIYADPAYGYDKIALYPVMKCGYNMPDDLRDDLHVPGATCTNEADFHIDWTKPNGTHRLIYCCRYCKPRLSELIHMS